MTLALAAGASAMPTQPPVPVLGSCLNKPLVRPKRIDVCGDGNFYLTNVRWASWDASGAVGAAIAHQNDCNPYCAAGHFHVYSAAVWLSRVRLCSDHRIQYTRLSYAFLARPPRPISAGPHVLAAPLGYYGGSVHCP